MIHVYAAVLFLVSFRAFGETASKLDIHRFDGVYSIVERTGKDLGVSCEVLGTLGCPELALHKNENFEKHCPNSIRVFVPEKKDSSYFNPVDLKPSTSDLLVVWDSAKAWSPSNAPAEAAAYFFDRNSEINTKWNEDFEGKHIFKDEYVVSQKSSPNEINYTSSIQGIKTEGSIKRLKDGGIEIKHFTSYKFKTANWVGDIIDKYLKLKCTYRKESENSGDKQ